MLTKIIPQEISNVSLNLLHNRTWSYKEGYIIIRDTSKDAFNQSQSTTFLKEMGFLVSRTPVS